MSRARLTLAAAAAAATLLLGAVPAEAKRSCTSLRARGDTVVAKTREAVVWSRARDGIVFGCHRAAGRARRLQEYHGLFNFALAGRYVAHMEFVEEFMEPVFIRLHVWNLVTGRRKLLVTMDGSGELVVKRNGSVAWIEAVEDDQTADVETWEVHAVSNEDGRGEVVLDAGPEIDRGSLLLSADRRTISWRNGGEIRSAPLR